MNKGYRTELAIKTFSLSPQLAGQGFCNNELCLWTCKYFAIKIQPLIINGVPLQWEAEVFNPPCIFPLTSIVNKSCNIECCVNNMFQINQNMIVSQGLELTSVKPV